MSQCSAHCAIITALKRTTMILQLLCMVEILGNRLAREVQLLVTGAPFRKTVANKREGKYP
jgi:hypothetical protein